MPQSHASFHTTREETILIGKIIDRAERLSQQPIDRMTAHMDLSACIANGCPLKLAELLDADDFDFAHDFWGIARHIDRKTGLLGDFFLPRYAKLADAEDDLERARR
jgi:hypothetical protein